MRTLSASMIAAAVVLAGCGHKPPEGGPGIDRMKTKFVMVSVNGQIALFPEPVLVGAANGVVKWMFDSDEPDYRFPADGVTFPEPPSAPPSSYGCVRVATAAEAKQRFNNCERKQHGKEFHCNSVGHAPPVGTCYYYALKVEPKAGGAAIVKDPWAKNQ